MAIPIEAAFWTIPQLGKALREKQFTSVELTRFFLERLGTIGKSLNAVAALCEKSALSEAERADQEFVSGKDRGPLHGIPYGAKDLLATIGIPTTWGAAPLRQQVFDEDATVIIKLREAGAILVAKLAMVEIAGGLGYRQANASWTGPGLNPWNKERWAGGSSSGSGSAVGGGCVPFALGSETWGSILTPAGYCGVTGFRPTYGRVSKHGAMALSWTMDKLGPLTRNAEDAHHILQVIAGPDPKDPSSFSWPCEGADFLRHSRAEARFKLGLIKGSLDRLQPEVKECCQAALEVFRKFSEVEEVELPPLPYGDVAGTIIACEMAAAFEGMVKSGDVWEMTAPEDRPGAHAAQYIPARDYINALRIRGKIQRAIDEVCSRYDALISPTLGSVAPPIDREFSSYYGAFSAGPLSGAANVIGLPGVTFPIGPGESGLPTAMQLAGRTLEEARILAIAHRFQQNTDWHRRHPESR